MTLPRRPQRPLGTMVAYGFTDDLFEADLAVARRLGAGVLEIFPDWHALPDPGPLRARVSDAGFAIHSAHGCWGGQSIRAARVDLGDTSSSRQAESLDDLRRCVDWLALAGGRCLVVHPGGLSAAEDFEARRAALGRGLLALAEHARGTPVALCVENMPPGVHPGSRMAGIAGLVAELNLPGVGLALDTGHAHISATVRSETLDARGLLLTTHVHDNDGRKDTHAPPGLGTIDWTDWAEALDAIDYRGPIVLECIRHLRQFPESIDAGLLEILKGLTRRRPAVE